MQKTSHDIVVGIPNLESEGLLFFGTQQFGVRGWWGGGGGHIISLRP